MIFFLKIEQNTAFCFCEKLSLYILYIIIIQGRVGILDFYFLNEVRKDHSTELHKIGVGIEFTWISPEILQNRPHLPRL